MFTLLPKNRFFSGANVVLEADSYFSPRRINKTRMTQTSSSSSPFDQPLNSRTLIIDH